MNDGDRARYNNALESYKECLIDAVVVERVMSLIT